MENNNQLIERKSWFKRNWIWAVSVVNCSTVIVITILLMGSGLLSFKDTIQAGTDEQQELIDQALLDAQQNQEVIEALGKPINVENGDYDPKLNNGVMILDMELIGSKSNGALNAKATKTENGWEFEIFTITVEETEEIIDITNKINN